MTARLIGKEIRTMAITNNRERIETLRNVMHREIDKLIEDGNEAK